MLCLARDLWCQVRLSKNCNLAVRCVLNSWRSYAANKLDYGSQDITSKPKFVPIGGASFVRNLPGATCDGPEIVSGFRYFPIIYRALFIEGFKALEAGASALDMNKGIDAAHDKVHAYLKRTARMVRTPKEIAQAATAAAYGDTQLGSCIAKGLQKVGNERFYIVDGNEELENKVEFVNVLKRIDTRYCSVCLTTNDNEICLLENPLILILVNKVLNKDVVDAVQQAMRSANRKRPRPLLISAEYVDKMEKTYFSRNMLCVIGPPNDRFLHRATWREMMEDLAILTGGQVVTEESDMNCMSQMLGSCKKVTVSEETLLIHDGGGDQKDIRKRREQLRSVGLPMAHGLMERIEFLSQTARFKVYKDCGGAIRATQRAMEHGILPGGGVALLHASKELDKLQPANSDMKLGVQFLQNALKMPVYYIAHVAGFDGSVVVDKLLEQDNPDLGYDPATGEFIEMIKSGNISRINSLTDELEGAVRHFQSRILGQDLAYSKPTQSYGFIVE